MIVSSVLADLLDPFSSGACGGELPVVTTLTLKLLSPNTGSIMLGWIVVEF